jgi:hypothetical protein
VGVGVGVLIQQTLVWKKRAAVTVAHQAELLLYLQLQLPGLKLPPPSWQRLRLKLQVETSWCSMLPCCPGCGASWWEGREWSL